MASATTAAGAPLQQIRGCENSFGLLLWEVFLLGTL